MLTWIEDTEYSGDLYATSEKFMFRTYWIEDRAWTYLVVASADRAGMNRSNPVTCNDIEEAKAKAEELEIA